MSRIHGAALLLGLVAVVTPGPMAGAHSPVKAASAITITRSVEHPLDGRFSLIDQDGKAISDKDFRGTPMLIYFGYTSCTDACPLDAQKITGVVDLLDERKITVDPIFITVDPQRDTPARLKEFLAHFHPRFVGLTGAKDNVHQVVLAYGSDDDPVNVKGPDSYDLDHPAIAYLMGRDGRFVDLVPLDGSAAAIADTIAAKLDPTK